MPELTETFPGQQVIDRTLVNAWHDRRVRDAVVATRRRKLLVAGTGLDVCAQLPALASAADGDQPYVVVDACGRFESQPSVATISRLTQAGVALVNTRVVVLEAMADNAHSRPRKSTPPCQPGWSPWTTPMGSNRNSQRHKRPRPGRRPHQTARREHACLAQQQHLPTLERSAALWPA